ncbi:MAG TPA: SDR family oxidoreductase [Pseudoclavibacter sp.]|nr:SDR family oxidoreductase [Pseudoclavibacter sp.]
MNSDRVTANSYAFAGKSVLVTGAGSGIGRAIARGFLDNGAHVVAAGRRRGPLLDTLASASPEQALAITADVSDRASVENLVAQTVEAWGGLDVIVSNAAIYESGELAAMSEQDWHTMFAVNVDGLYHLVCAAAPHLEASQGNVVAVSSVSGDFGDWGQAAYNSTKHAVTGLIRSLALDYGQRGVRFNAVAPAFTMTDMTEGVWEGGADLTAFTNRIALARPGRPEDVVGAALFLASPDASYITGSVLTVDGGTSASSGQPHIE